MRPISVLHLGYLILFAAIPGEAFECGGAPNSRGITVFDSGFVFSTPKLEVDADGAPNSYMLDGSGLSYTCDGVAALDSSGHKVNARTDPKNWQQRCKDAWAHAKATNDYKGVAIFGFAKDKANRPVVQGEGDSLAGKAYLSTTTVQVPGAPSNSQRSQIDARKIPYIVLPSNIVSSRKVKPAALAIVYRPKNGQYAFAVYGDIGGALGEGSIRLHKELGSEPVVKRSGVNRAKQGIGDRVVTVVFPTTPVALDTNEALTLERIAEAGKAKLAKIGGLEGLKACAETLRKR